MDTIVDLTMPINPSMTYNPDHFQPELVPYGSIEHDGWAATRLVLSTHTGTHVDAPSHFVAGGLTLDQIPLDTLIGTAQVLDVRQNGDRQAIDTETLPEVHSTRVLLHTGWSDGHMDADDYYAAQPFLTVAAARSLIDQGVILVGIDAPSVDYFPSDTHKELLGNGVIVVENLVNLGSLPSSFELMVLPLPLAEGDGSPARAVAVY